MRIFPIYPFLVRGFPRVSPKFRGSPGRRKVEKFYTAPGQELTREDLKGATDPWKLNPGHPGRYCEDQESICMLHIQGLVNVPFWGFWTSPSNICWKLYPQYLGDIQLGHLPTPDIESYAFMYAAYICILCMRVCRYSLHMYDAGQCRSWTSAVIWVNSS